MLAYLEDKERDGEFFKIEFEEAIATVLELEVKTTFSLDEIEAREAKNKAFIDSLNNLHQMAREQKTKA